MDSIIWMSLVYPIIGVISLVIIIYLIVKRVNDKQKENFEDRSN